MAEISIEEVKGFLESMEGENITLNELRREFNILQGTRSFNSIRVIMHRLAEQRIVKPLGTRGEYRVLKQIDPVQWWNGAEDEALDFRFPRSYEDETEFGIEDCLDVFAGDLILLAGTSNYGKTALALSILGENLDLFPGARLMGSEYTAADGKISPKFKRRINRMSWARWIVDGKPRFELLPIGSDYEDYIKADWLNVVDWVSLPGEYYLIDRVMKASKDRIGNGVLVMVLQKNRTSDFAEGGERAERYADVCLYIDPYGESESMLRLGKVKAPKGRASGRTWAFSIVDYGANLHNIREVVKCPRCYGRGYIRSGQNNIRCDKCLGKKYIDK